MSTYEITKVDADYRTWQAKKGPAAGQDFHSYNISAKGPDGELRDYEITRKPTSGPPPLGVVEAEVQPSNGSFPDKLKLTPQGRSGGSSQAKDDYWRAKEERDVESQARMGRAHAQEMALRAFGTLAELRAPKELLEALRTQNLSRAIDWFHKDVQRFPDADGGGGPSPSAKASDATQGVRKDDGATFGQSSQPAAAVSTPEPPSSAQKGKITNLLNKNVAMKHHADLKAQATTKNDASQLISRLIKVDSGEADVPKLLEAYGITPESELPWEESA